MKKRPYWAIALQNARKTKKLTQADVANKLHIATNSLQQYELGLRMPSYTLMKSICNILDITIYDVMVKPIVSKSLIFEDDMEALKNNTYFFNALAEIIDLFQPNSKFTIITQPVLSPGFPFNYVLIKDNSCTASSDENQKVFDFPTERLFNLHKEVLNSMQSAFIDKFTKSLFAHIDSEKKKFLENKKIFEEVIESLVLKEKIKPDESLILKKKKKSD